MQPARLKARPERPVPEKATTTAPVSPRQPPPSPPAKGSGVAFALVIAVALISAAAAGVAGYLLYAEKAVVAGLREERVALEQAQEERIKALTRRLVAVMARGQTNAGSGGGDGEGAFADLITRQVELEARQVALGGLISQLAGSLLPDGAQRAGAPAMSGQLFLERLDASLSSAQRQQIGALLRQGEAMPVKERVDNLNQSLERVESAQTRLLGGLGGVVVNKTQEIKAAVAEIGLDPGKVKLPNPQPAMGGPFIPVTMSGQRGAFEQSVAQLEGLRSTFSRWRELAGIIPFTRPLPGDDTTTSNFGTRTDPFTGATAMHAGMDFRAEVGTPVRAPGAGKVLRAEVAGGYGNLIELDHGNGLTTRYGHLSAFEVKPGQIVPRGAIIGRVGSTGRSTGPHLHYETRRDEEAMNPLRFIQLGARLGRGVQAAP